jgi:hypothetical protein
MITRNALLYSEKFVPEYDLNCSDEGAEWCKVAGE